MAWAALLVLATPPALLMEAHRLAGAADHLAARMAPSANRAATAGAEVATATGPVPRVDEARAQLRARAGMMTMIALALVAFFLAAVIVFAWDYYGPRGAARRRRNAEPMRE
jgi:hypothetical protein